MLPLLLDLKYAVRQLRKSPGFTATAVLMLAFGIGATTAVFSIVEGVLLRPLPFADPERLVILGDHLGGTDWGQSTGSVAPVTAPEIGTYARDTRAFASMGGYTLVASYELTGAVQPAQVSIARVGAGVFATLGVAPLLGRVYTTAEEEERQHVTVLSYETYRSRFHGDPSVVGTKIQLDRRPYIIVGVMPESFEFPLVPGRLNRSEMWIPLSPSVRELTQGAATWGFALVARLKPGVTPEQAQSDAERVAQEIQQGFKADMASMHITAVVSPLQSLMVARARPLVRTLFLAVAVVLLIACANLAGLLLVRAIRRQREIAVRIALGAPAFTLLRQVLLESLAISVTGGLLGTGVAAGAILAGSRLLPESLPRLNEIGLNWKVACFGLVLAILTGLVCGLAPAFAALHTNVNASLKEGGRSGSAGGSHGRLRSALVVVEIAIALMLLTASGLLLRSFARMSAVELGFEPEHVTTALYSLPAKQYESQSQIDSFTNELLRRLGQLPGAEAAAIATGLPASGVTSDESFVLEGYALPRGVAMTLAALTQVKGEYFHAMGIPLLRGRFFNDGDRKNTQLVVIVNHSFAERYWPHQDAIGKRLHLGTKEMQLPWMTVVGEIADVKLISPEADAGDQFYEPLDQAEVAWGSFGTAADKNGDSGYVVLRSALPGEQMENAMAATARSIDPLLPLTQMQTMTQAVSDSESSRRFNTVLIGGFAVAAVLLAVLGIYSVISFSVAARVQEMAIRMALGSRRADIVRLILASGARLAAMGCVLGLGGAAAVSGVLRSLLFGVSPFDPLVLILATVAIFLLALAAAAVPAQRAASVDPMQALRSE